MANSKENLENPPLFDKRFWTERPNTYKLDSLGYLADPEAPALKYLSPVNSQLCATEALAENPCVVLLGEPGTGKSYELDLPQLIGPD